ncbi:peptidase M16 [Clostridiaceae bacterium 14S0207]|nr:peptidase M16 [Clostridiaceae bacterium 14S0207]
MEFLLNNTYHGFKLIEERQIEELKGVGRIFEHEKSGARLFSIQNEDDNKIFTVSFRTPPYDNTGVPHILEHSVLCGSRKFPTKEPFVELIKGSLNTFLNAFTFSDKTMYPVGSTNDKDFMNLMNVYLDAVFYPNLHNTPEILMQEGWHYEIENKEEPLTYKGVVYNEMQGAFSSPEGILFRKIQESLFKDTIYSNESGGDPEFIPNLTQEQFVAFHKKYYHPSNSYITLYGNGDLDNQLKFIDDEYLKDFDKMVVDSKIDLQKPYMERKEVEVPYSLSAEEDEKDKTFLSLNFVAGTSKDDIDHLGMDILEYLLLENPASPLKNALISSKIGKDVFGFFDSSIIQPVFSVVIKNSNPEKKDEFEKIVFDTLQKLVNEGIDKKLIEACINITEFKLREGESGYPKGLLNAMVAMDSWLYDGDPFLFIQYDRLIKTIREKAENGYFEQLIKKYLLNNAHSTLLVLKPEKGLGDKKQKELVEKLKTIKDSLSDEELDKIIENTARLKKRQNTPDSEEALKTIPLLSIDDIEKNATKLDTEVKDVNGVKILKTNTFTNKIAYIMPVFDIGALEKDLVPYASLLGYILGKVSTENKNFMELANEININTGGIDFGAEAYVDNKDVDKYYRKFSIRAKALTDKVPELMKILSEVITSSKFDEYSRLHELIRELKSRIEMSILDRGHTVAFNRLISYFSPAGAYMEEVIGISFYKFLAELDKNFDTKKEEIKNNLEKASGIIFNKNNLIIGVVGENPEFNAAEQSLSELTDSLSHQVLQEVKYDFKVEPKNEGLLTPANVQYVAKGFNINKLGFNYSGTLIVAKTIISLDYLWNKVRVQGGAYGCSTRLSRGGNAGFSSYRDPNIEYTLDVYNNTEKYLKNFEASEREMTKYIIGTISNLDYPLSPAMKGEKALSQYIKGLKFDQIQKEREEVLSTNVDKIRELSKLFEELMKQNFYCVLGNENKIKENKELFNNLVTLFE